MSINIQVLLSVSTPIVQVKKGLQRGLGNVHKDTLKNFQKTFTKLSSGLLESSQGRELLSPWWYDLKLRFLMFLMSGETVQERTLWLLWVDNIASKGEEKCHMRYDFCRLCNFIRKLYDIQYNTS